MTRQERSRGALRSAALLHGSTGLVILLVLGLYAGLGSLRGFAFFNSQPGSYYAALTEGFLAGQTHLKQAPDPRLAELDNPYAGYQGIPRWHDATYFRGRYYLYFGATPAVVLIAPFWLLTGQYLTDAALVLIFASFGFLAAAALWLRICRTGLLRLGLGWVNAGVLVLGLGTLVPTVLIGASFYVVPILCGYALLMVGFYALFRALGTTWEGGQGVWMLLASAAWGLAVGARPNYVFTLPALGLVALGLVLRARDERGRAGWRVQAGLAVAVLLPPLLVGLALAAYNFVRFGDVAEFGARYQFASVDQRFIRFFSPDYFAGNIQAYLLDPICFTRYYPFTWREGLCWSVLGWTPFAVFALALPAAWIWGPWKHRRGWVGIGVAALLTALLQLSALLFLAYANDRYGIDFVPALMLAALLAFGACVERWGTGRRWARLLLALSMAAALVTIGLVLLLVTDGSLHSGARTLPRLLNHPTYWCERLAGTEYGAVSGEISFADSAVGGREPLVSTGRGRDVLFCERLPGNRIRFALLHRGTMTPYSDSLEVVPGKSYSFTFDLGSLYPPADHPIYAAHSRGAVDALLRRVRVVFDGKVALDVASSFYPSSPGWMEIGTNQRGIGTLPRFSGRMEKLRRGGVPAPASGMVAEGEGPVRLTVKFPPFVSVRSEPLVSTGRSPQGDIIYVTYLAPGKVRFHHDSLGQGMISSRTISFDPAVEHTIDVDAPSLEPGRDQAREGRLLVRFDGDLVLSAWRAFFPNTPEDTAFGYNAVRSGAVGALFTGESLRVSRIGRDHDPLTSVRGWGALRFVAQLDAQRSGSSEPLVTTGVPGKGNIIYLLYLANDRLQIGYDHWGVGGFLGDPFTIDPTVPLTFEISTGSLYPPEDDPWWSAEPGRARAAKHRVWVRCNGQVVANASFASHPSNLESIRVGENPIGGSTCGYSFSGEIRDVETIPIPSEIR